MLAVAFIATSFDTAWTARVPSTSRVDPSLGAGEVALVHTTSGHAGALSFSLAQLGATEIDTEAAADTVIARLSAQALAAIKTDPKVTIATRDIPIVALDQGRGTGFEKERGSNDDSVKWSGQDREQARKSLTTGVSTSLEAIRGPLAWTTTTGKGATVAIMDTGIADHKDLDGRVRSRIDFVKDGSDLKDAGGHGTFIAGVIAANGVMKGVAPEAKLISLRVLDASGNGTMKNVIAAFSWVLKHNKDNQIDVLNISWGAPQATTYHKDLLSALVEAVWFSGVTVVAAAGNDGPGASTVTAPATDPFIVTVGSFNDQGTAAAAGDDTLSSFSAQGPTLDGFAKPDILAPGEHVASLRAKGVTYIGADGNPIGSPTDQYIHMTGTSASAAFVSGVAALVASARHFSPTKTKGAIVASARAIAGSAAGAIDAPNALTRTPAAVNVGLKPSKLLLALIARSRQLHSHGVTWEGVTWEGVTWDGVTWDGVTWDGVTWDGVTWESVSWESISWESVSWETVTWEGVTWEESVIAE